MQENVSQFQGDSSQKDYFEIYVQQGLKLILCKGFHPQFNPTEDYKTAKQPITKGYTDEGYVSPTLPEVQQWITAGGWVSALLPTGFMAIDVENKANVAILREIFKSLGIFPGVHVTNNGFHFLFKISQDLKAYSSIATRCGIEVTYRIGGKSPLVFAPINGRVWENWKDLADLPELPEELLPCRKDSREDLLSRLSVAVGEAYNQGQLAGYEDIDLAYSALLLHLGFDDRQIQDSFNLIFQANYQENRTKWLLENTRERLAKNQNIIGTGRFLKVIKDGKMEKIQRLTMELIDLSSKKAPGTVFGNKGSKDEKDDTQLVELFSDLLTFLNQYKEGHTFYDGKVISLESEKLKHLVAMRYLEATKKLMGTELLKKITLYLSSKASMQGEVISLFNRVAKFEGAILYDKGDGQAIRTDHEGFKIVPAPILFNSYSHQQVQVTPDRNGDPWRLFELVNVAEEHKLLVLVTLISSFIPNIPHPPINPVGRDGSGKTSFCNFFRQLVDPSSIGVMIMPSSYRELVQNLAHHYFCFFDNLQNLTDWQSNLFAMACTGGGFSKRKLFTNDEDVVYSIKRCIGFNGINSVIKSNDLLQRSITIKLEKIDDSKRTEERKLQEKFDLLKPGILGGIFTTLSKAMKLYPEIESIKFKSTPRMADFARWGYAISEGLEKDSGKVFLESYLNLIQDQNQQFSEKNSLVSAILSFMDNKLTWSGLMSEAWKELSKFVDPNPSDETFPASSNRLREYLQRVETNLGGFGITYEISKKRSNKGFSITFKKAQSSDEDKQDKPVTNIIRNPNNTFSCKSIDTIKSFSAPRPEGPGVIVQDSEPTTTPDNSADDFAEHMRKSLENSPMRPFPKPFEL